MVDKLKMYVKTRDGSPIIEVGSNKHRPFSKKGLDEVLKVVEEYAVVLREQWNDEDWFPCGFVNLKVNVDGALAKFLKENNETPDLAHVSARYKTLTLMPPFEKDDEQQTLYFKMSMHDAITSQCMRYKQRVYEQLQVLLAFLCETTGLETAID